MFGNPDWFKPKTLGWGLTPVRWQGWAYSLAWISVIGLPFVLLLMREQPAESFAWLTVSMGALIYDVRDIRRKMQRATFSNTAADIPTATAVEKDVFYIGDSEASHSNLATRNYALQLKKR